MTRSPHGAERKPGGRRLGVGIVSLAAMACAFAATNWLIGRLAGTGSARAPLPTLARATPQPVPLPPVAASPARATRRAEPVADDPSAVQARLAAAAEAAEEAARARVVGEATAVDEPLEVRLDLYLRALRAALEASGDAALLAQRGVWTEHFLRLAPVQEELAAMAPGARAAALARIRRGMGYEPEEIESLAERDAARQQRWDVGLAYMQERRLLEERFAGAPPEEELRRLRERFFDYEARTIELEEADGFFRFERPRVYGRN